MTPKKKIISVVVTYRPVLSILKELLAALVPQVASIVIVDNGSVCDLAESIEEYKGGVELICLGENMGIAAAQNRGIYWARDNGADFVLLMDQDSIPAPDMIDKLIAALAVNLQAAAVGPRYLDLRQNNPPPFIQVRGLRLVRCPCSSDDSVVPVDYLIASGCLIPMSVIDNVGNMQEDYFIDFVDIEWGLRARHHGFQSYGVCAAHMAHSLGESPINMLGMSFPVHTPLRHYYHFRNSIRLNKTKWVPLSWKLANTGRMCLKYVFYLLFAKPHSTHWYMMTAGVWHGLLGKVGRYEKRKS